MDLDDLSASALLWRMGCIERGADPRMFHGGATAAELRVYNRMRGRSEEHSHAIKREEALTTTDESAIVSECEDHVRLHGGTLSDPGVGQLDSPSVEPN